MSAEFCRQFGWKTQRTWSGAQVSHRTSVHDGWQGRSYRWDKCATKATSSRSVALVEPSSTSSLAIELNSNLLVGVSADSWYVGKEKSGSGEVKMLMGFEQDAAGTAEAQPARFGSVPALPSKAEVEQHELTHLQFRSWCRHCVRAKGEESPNRESTPDGVSKFATDCMDGTSITISAGYDGLTKAFFCKRCTLQKHESWLRRKSTCAQRVVHRQSESDIAERPRTEHHPNTKPTRTSQPKSCAKKPSRRQQQQWH